MYLDANNLYGWAMPQKLPVNGFEWVEDLSEFKEDLIKKYDEDLSKNLHNLHSDLPFLPERMKIAMCNKLVCDFHDKKNYVVHKKTLKNKH